MFFRHHRTSRSWYSGADSSSREDKAIVRAGAQFRRVLAHSYRGNAVSLDIVLFHLLVYPICSSDSHSLVSLSLNHVNSFGQSTSFKDSQYYVNDPEFNFVPVDKLLSKVFSISFPDNQHVFNCQEGISRFSCSAL